MKISETAAIARISELGMDDMPVMEYTPKAAKLPPNWFQTYHELAHKFMETLTDCATELAFMNLSQNEFMNLVTGRALPRNTSIRWRIPITIGGEFADSYLQGIRFLSFVLVLSDFAESVWLHGRCQPNTL